MALNTSGPISIAGTVTGQSIQIELLGNGTTQMSLNDAAVRTLAGVASGQIAMPTNFYGKSNTFKFNINSDQVNANLRTLAVAAGWNQSSNVEATIIAGVYVWSNSTGTPAMTIDGAWPGGVTLINNGYIIGMGGNGGNSLFNSSSQAAISGQNGGPAINLGFSITLVNNGYIAGGGGGGASGSILNFGITGGGGGGGAGGGGGGLTEFSGGDGPAYTTQAYGGAGGAIGQAGGVGSFSAYAVAHGWATNWPTGMGGGGGGRILPGTGGAGGVPDNVPFSSHSGMGGGGGAGGGGGWGSFDKTSAPWPNGGDGGSAGNAGSSAPSSNGMPGGGGGGGWGASGGTSPSSSLPGAGGKAIQLNSYTATRSGTGTTYGAVS